MRSARVVAVLLFVLTATVVQKPAVRAAPGKAAVGSQSHASILPASFEANHGQAGKGVQFLARGSGYALYLTATEIDLALQSPPAAPDAVSPQASSATPGVTRATIRLRLTGANPGTQMEGVHRLPGRVNYLIGPDPSRWLTGIPTYSGVRYDNVYPGTDLLFALTGSGVEYSWLLRKGANPSAIRMQVSGARNLRLDSRGNLIVSSGGGTIVQAVPTTYQTINGSRHTVASRYVLGGDGRLTVRVGRHDSHRALVIDPVLKYSTFLGARPGPSDGTGIAVDRAGNIFVAGGTSASGFPTSNALQGNLVGTSAALVAKLDPTGATLLYSTYLGGLDDNIAFGLAVDAGGDAYLTGYAGSGFPGATDPYSGGSDAYVAELDPSGSKLLFSTYLGGSRGDVGNAIALDATGGIVVTGFTRSTDFPTVHALQSVKGGENDAFVARLARVSHDVTYSTYLGGDGDDVGLGVAVDAQGAVYVTGSTTSSNFPAVSAFEPQPQGGGRCSGAFSDVVPCSDAFVAKIAPDGGRLVYSTYLGGTGDEIGNYVAVDGAGEAVVTGYTSSTDFPVAHAAQPAYGGGGTDAFITKVRADGSAPVYSTYWGGSDADAGIEVAVDGAGTAYTAGFTGSKNLKTVNPLQARFGGGGSDAIFATLEPSGAMVTSTYLGGGGIDLGLAITLGPNGDAYMAGSTSSKNFPIDHGVQPTYGGGDWEVFVAELGPGHGTLPAPPTKKCTKNAAVKHGKCACKKGYVMSHGKCVKKKH